MKENVWNEIKKIYLFMITEFQELLLRRKKIRKRNKNSSYKRNKCQLINA